MSTLACTLFYTDSYTRLITQPFKKIGGGKNPHLKQCTILSAEHCHCDRSYLAAPWSCISSSLTTRCWQQINKDMIDTSIAEFRVRLTLIIADGVVTLNTARRRRWPTCIYSLCTVYGLTVRRSTSIHRLTGRFMDESFQLINNAPRDRTCYGRPIGQAIIFCSCGFFLLLSFFLAYSLRSQIGCLRHFHTWCGI